MPTSADHRVEMFRLASQRRAAGLSSWAERINLRDVFHNEEMTFEERRDATVRRLRVSRWYKNRDTSAFDELGDAVADLADAKNAEEFDEWWDALCDLADYARVWIAIT